MSLDQPNVLASHEVATAAAEAMVGQTPTETEVALVKEAASDLFVQHTSDGKSREQAAQLVNAAIAELMAPYFTPEQLDAFEVKGREIAAEKLRSEIQERQNLLNAVIRSQAEGGPEVKSRGMTVTDPERRAPETTSFTQAA
jgi:hypothetical protein